MVANIFQKMHYWCWHHSVFPSWNNRHFQQLIVRLLGLQQNKSFLAWQLLLLFDNLQLRLVELKQRQRR